MQHSELTIKFAEATAAEANVLSSSLMDKIRDVAPEAEVSRVRERPDSQDFGTVLVLVLGTAAVEVIARGISAWLTRNSGAKIELTRNGQTVQLSAENLDSCDVPKLVAALRGDAPP
jgi:hypothetical protein